MEVKLLIKIKSLLLFFFFSIIACKRTDNYPYIQELAKDLELNYQERDPSLSNFSNKTFYIECVKGKSYYILTYLDIFNDFLSKSKMMSPKQYISELFNSKIRINNKDCSDIDMVVFEKYANNLNLMLTETSTSKGKFLRTDINMNDQEINTLLFLYFQNGYLIGFDDYIGVVTLTKLK